MAKNDTLGIFYELPDGRIAYTYGWSGKSRIVSYYFDDGEGGRQVSDEEFQTWKPRQDLKDFPNARDPRLPYEFDLHWDIKYLSELKKALYDESYPFKVDKEHLWELVRYYKIEV